MFVSQVTGKSHSRNWDSLSDYNNRLHIFEKDFSVHHAISESVVVKFNEEMSRSRGKLQISY